jgi:hypothetical protein
MAQYRVLASEWRQRYIYTKTHKNIKEKKLIGVIDNSEGSSEILAGFRREIRKITKKIRKILKMKY